MFRWITFFLYRWVILAMVCDITQTICRIRRYTWSTNVRKQGLGSENTNLNPSLTSKITSNFEFAFFENISNPPNFGQLIIWSYIKRYIYFLILIVSGALPHTFGSVCASGAAMCAKAIRTAPKANQQKIFGPIAWAICNAMGSTWAGWRSKRRADALNSPAQKANRTRCCCTLILF